MSHGGGESCIASLLERLRLPALLLLALIVVRLAQHDAVAPRVADGVALVLGAALGASHPLVQGSMVGTEGCLLLLRPRGQGADAGVVGEERGVLLERLIAALHPRGQQRDTARLGVPPAHPVSHAGDALVIGVRLVARLGALLRGRRGLAPATRAAAAGQAAEASGASEEAQGAAWEPTDPSRGPHAAPSEGAVLREVVEVDDRVGRDHRVGLKVGLHRLALLARAHLAAEVEPLGGRPL